MAGLFLGIAFITLRERVDYNIRSPGESPACLRIPELGAVPTAELSRSVKPLLIAEPDGDIEIQVAAENGHPAGSLPAISTTSHEMSVVAESFRAILASILFSPRNDIRAPGIVITSAGPGEGKSTITSNLGLAMAETDRRVLLIDGDLRNPRLHEIFAIPNRAGLADLLRNDESPELATTRLVRVTAKSSLYVLPAGNTSGRISNLLYSARLPKLLERLREEFDAILIDSPPMIQAPDARILARAAGTVVLVIRAGQTSRDTAAAAKQRFADDGTPVIGTILNDWNLKSASDSSYRKYYNRNGSAGSNGKARS
jgi:succinoglycan biosynthesis transport protein ExoP